MLAATVANVNRDAKAHPQPFVIDDFMPAEPVAPPTPEEEVVAAKARMDSLFSGMGSS